MIDSIIELESKSKKSWDKGYKRFVNYLNKDDPVINRQLENLKESFTILPKDPYDSSGTRYRQYSRAVYLPWKGSIDWVSDDSISDGLKKIPYYQGEFNPEHSLKWRYFDPISKVILDNPVFKKIIEIAVKEAVWEEIDFYRPISIGAHVISQKVDLLSNEAFQSPCCMHQDGEMYDYVFLIDRKNIEGGMSYIANTASVNILPENVHNDNVIDRFTLNEPLEGFGVKDIDVSHGVERIRLKKGANSGYRNTILVDLTPMYENLR